MGKPKDDARGGVLSRKVQGWITAIAAVAAAGVLATVLVVAVYALNVGTLWPG